MQLTELLHQRVKDLGQGGQVALKSGYVAVVSKAATLRAALVAGLCPGADDQKRLVDGSAGTTRVGVGLIGGAEKKTYRVLREIGGVRQLLRLDPATKKFETISEDQLEIDSFLRVECGMPHPDAYKGFFVVEVNELPSLRGKAAAAASDAYLDQSKVKALREELEATKKFEAMQDRLFKVQQRLHDLTVLQDKVHAAEQDLRAIDGELKRSPWSPEEMKELTARASKFKEELKKRDDALAEVAHRRQKALQATPPPPDPVLKSPWFVGGLTIGIGIDTLAFMLRKPPIAFGGLLPFLAALIATLRWIHEDEADKEAAALVKELKDREKDVKRTWDEGQAKLKSAMRTANVDSASDLLDVFRERELVAKRREEARAKLEKLKKEPELSRVPVEIPMLKEEKAKLDDQVLAMGFSRPLGEIEADLKHAMGLTRGSVTLSEADVPKSLIDRAAELANLSTEDLWEQISQRLTAYLQALTDKRVAGAKLDDKGQLQLVAPDGRTGAYTSMPPPLRDLVYAALRLTLLERVAQYKRLPVVIDDAFATLDAAKQALIGKMLKGIGTQTQVIHRVAQAPPAGTADAVLQA